MTKVLTLTSAMHDAGEKGGELIPKLVRPGALKNEGQRRALRDQAGKPELLCCPTPILHAAEDPPPFEHELSFLLALGNHALNRSLGVCAGVKSLGDLGRLLEELPRPFVDFLKVQAIIRGAATKLGSSLHDRLRINATYAQQVKSQMS